MSDNQTLLPPELLEEMFAHTPRDPEGMAAFISMVTNTFAAQIAGLVAANREDGTQDRADLIRRQMAESEAVANDGGSYKDFRLEWVEDLSAYTHREALWLLNRAAMRQMRVYEGKHTPFSDTRGKGFGNTSEES